MFVGILFGPAALKWVNNADEIQKIGDVGIFLLFLLGLHLHPQNLIHLLKKVTFVSLISSIVFALCGFSVANMPVSFRKLL